MAIWPTGTGIGSRKSYSLYSRFSIRQILVYVGRSTWCSPSGRGGDSVDAECVRDALRERLNNARGVEDHGDRDGEDDELHESDYFTGEQEEERDDPDDSQEQRPEKPLQAEYDLKPEADLVVVQDELDFPLGTLRIQTRRSSAGHNGIESIIGALGTQDFLRIRIGVAPDRKVADGQSYLLAPLRKAELQVAGGILDTVEEAVKVILKEGPAAAMNRFNRKPEDNGKD